MIEKRLLLALDLSTVVMGYSIFDIDTLELIKIGYYSFEKSDLISKGIELKNELKDIINEYEGIIEIGIESLLKNFQSGMSNMESILKLASFNFLCQFLVQTEFSIKIKTISSGTARGLVFPGFHKISRSKKGVKDKEVAFEMVRNILGESYFPTKILKSGKNKGNIIYIEECRDMSDSWIIGKAILKLKEPIEEIPVKVKKIKKNKEI